MVTGISGISLKPALREADVSHEIAEAMEKAIRMRAAIAYWTITQDHFLSDSLGRLLGEPGSFLCVDIHKPTDLDVMAQMASENPSIYLHLARLGSSSDRRDLTPPGMPPYLLHQKMLLFDYPGDHAELWVGSHNWTRRALEGPNIESSLVLSLDVGSPLYQEASNNLEYVRTELCEQMDPAQLDLYKALQMGEKQADDGDVIEIEGEEINTIAGEIIRIFGTDEKDYGSALLTVNKLLTLNAQDSSTEETTRYAARVTHTGYLSGASVTSDTPVFPSNRWAQKIDQTLPKLLFDSEPPQDMVDTCSYFVTLEVLHVIKVNILEPSAKVRPWQKDENSLLLDRMTQSPAESTQTIYRSPEISGIGIQAPNEDWSPRVSYESTLPEKRANEKISLVVRRQIVPIE